jgi:antirestriction protein ArdC
MRITLQKYMDKMQEAVYKMLSDGSIKEYLKLIARFRNYSFTNTLLIFAQRPDSTQVAGMGTWNKLGRRVKKGEKGIMIFAPLFTSPKKRKKNGEEGESEEVIEHPAIDSAGAGKKKETVLSGFRAVYVFDVSQTYGKDPPSVKGPERPEFLAAEGTDVDAFYERVLSVCPVPVDYKDIGGSIRGYYDYVADKITISTALTALEKPKTLIHEIAHKLAYEAKEHTMAYGDRPMAEVVAEGAAFIVCSHYGLDTSSYSFRYVALWGRDTKKISSWGKALMRTANRLIDLIESPANEQKKAA